MRTVTYDPLEYKLVPIKLTDNMTQVYNQSVANWEGFITAIEKAIAAAPDYPADTGWIPCSERLPELNTTVALLNIKTWMNFDVNWCGCGWLCEFGHQYWNVIGERGGRTMDSVTHWMALPSAPKGEE